jgi:hypothetical protein
MPNGSRVLGDIFGRLSRTPSNTDLITAFQEIDFRRKTGYGR